MGTTVEPLLSVFESFSTLVLVSHRQQRNNVHWQYSLVSYVASRNTVSSLFINLFLDSFNYGAVIAKHGVKISGKVTRIVKC